MLVSVFFSLLEMNMNASPASFSVQLGLCPACWNDTSFEVRTKNWAWINGKLTKSSIREQHINTRLR